MENAKELARHSLDRASYDPKKLALLHMAAVVAATLLTSLLSYFLDLGIAGTGGLDGIGFRAVLSSAQSLLSLAVTVLLPFWELGLVFTGMQLAREKQVGPASLCAGFRRFMPALRLLLLQAAMYTGVIFACVYAAYTIFMFTPFFESTFAVLEPLLESADTLVLDDATVAAVLPTLVPMYVILAVVLLVVAAPMYYRYRMAQYALLDGNGARKSMALSTHIMRGRRLALFKVDLRFWWYYGLQLLIAAVAYGDVLLPALGVTLPFGDTVCFWLFYGLSAALQLFAAWRFAPLVQTAYAHCYDTYRQYAMPQAPKPGYPKA